MTAIVLFPLATWLEGTNQNSTPANDNSLRVEALLSPAAGFANSAPSSPADHAQWIVGTSWGGHTSGNVVIFLGGTWKEFASYDGMSKFIAGSPYTRASGTWVEDAGGAGYSPPAYSEQTDSYAAAVTDAPATSLNQGIIAMNKATATVLTIKKHANQAWGAQTMLQVIQLGAGQITVAPEDSDVTIHSSSTLQTRAQYSTLLLTYLGSDVWILSGDMA